MLENVWDLRPIRISLQKIFHSTGGTHPPKLMGRLTSLNVLAISYLPTKRTCSCAKGTIIQRCYAECGRTHENKHSVSTTYFAKVTESVFDFVTVCQLFKNQQDDLFETSKSIRKISNFLRNKGFRHDVIIGNPSLFSICGGGGFTLFPVHCPIEWTKFKTRFR